MPPTVAETDASRAPVDPGAPRPRARHRTASRPDTGMFRALRVRNYRLHSFANLVSITGTWMQVVAQNWMVLELTGSTTALGASVSLQALPTVVLSMWGGVLADRVDRRRFLLWIQVAHALLALCLAAIAYGGPSSVTPLFVFALLTGSVTALEGPASASFAGELVPRHLLGNAIALGSAISSTGRIVGMALAGVVVGAVGPEPVFLINGLSYVAVIGGFAALRTAELQPAPRVPRAAGQLREGLRYVARSPQLLILLVLAWFLSGFGRNFQVTMAAMTAGPLGSGAGGYGQASMVFAIGAFAGAFLSARVGAMTRRVLLFAAVVTAASQVLAGVAPGMSVFLLAMAPAAIGAVVIDTAVMSLAQLGTDEAIRGRVLAILGLVTTSATMVGGPLLGWVADHFGARASLVLGGTVAGVAVIAATRAFRRSPRRAAHEPRHDRGTAHRRAARVRSGAGAREHPSPECQHLAWPHGSPTDRPTRRCRRCQLRSGLGVRDGTRS